MLQGADEVHQPRFQARQEKEQQAPPRAHLSPPLVEFPHLGHQWQQGHLQPEPAGPNTAPQHMDRDQLLWQLQALQEQLRMQQQQQQVLLHADYWPRMPPSVEATPVMSFPQATSPAGAFQQLQPLRPRPAACPGILQGAWGPGRQQQVHVCKRTCVHAYTHAQAHPQMHARKHTRMCMHTNVYIRKCTLLLYISMHVRMYVCV